MVLEGSTQPKTASVLPETPVGPVLVPALSRLGFPVLLFGGVFLGLTVVLTVLVSPDRFPVRVGDRIVRLSELEAEEKALRVSEATLLKTRASLKTEEKAPVLHQVAKLKATLTPVGRSLLLVDQVRLSFKNASTDPISLPRIHVRTDGTIVIGGEVRDLGGRSVQLLASFVDGLRDLPTVASVSEPEYLSAQEKDGTSVSPFTLTLTLNHD